MTELHLLVQPDSLSRSALGTISGGIALHFDEHVFPASDWSDLVVAVSLAWLETLVRIDRRDIREARVHFLDGPFCVDVRLDGGSIIVGLVESTLKRDVLRHQMSANLKEVLRDAASTVAQILHECRLRGWNDDEIARLYQLKHEAQELFRRESPGEHRTAPRAVPQKKPRKRTISPE
jgi:hypothetical protein